MKKLLFVFFACLLLFACDQIKSSDQKNTSTDTGNYIEWIGENEVANQLAIRGMRHFMNAEQEKAYAFFEAAVAEDPSMFAPHVCLAEMSLDGSEKQKFHIEEAKKNVMDNNETSKVFVALLDQEPDGFWGYFDSSKAHDLWGKMHKLEPRGNFIRQFYVHTMKDNEKSIQTINNFISEAKENDAPYENLLNLLGYKLMATGDVEGAKKAFSEYINAYPNGYNAYDSMGEYYLKNKMNDEAKEYYSEALEKYPFANNARNVILKMSK